MTITQERLKELLNYDPETGVFTWKVARGRPIGAAGCESQGRLVIRIDRKLHLAHRLAFLYMEGAMPSDCVDHLSGDAKDNRWCNLRHATSEVNNKNRKLVNSTSGHVGVYFNKASGKWQAYLNVLGKRKHLGLFATKEEAAVHRFWTGLLHGYHPNHGRTA